MVDRRYDVADFDPMNLAGLIVYEMRKSGLWDVTSLDESELRDVELDCIQTIAEHPERAEAACRLRDNQRNFLEKNVAAAEGLARTSTLSKMRDGTYIAFGRLSRIATQYIDPPCAIPADLWWFLEPDFERSTAVGGTLDVFDIRCVPRADLTAEEFDWVEQDRERFRGTLMSLKSTEPGSQKTGRGPTIRDDYKWVAAKLIAASHETGDGLLGKSQTDVVKMVQELFQREYRDEPADSTLHVWVKELCRFIPSGNSGN